MTTMLDWFDVRELEPGVFAIEEPLHVERVKSHLVIGSERAVLIDTGMGVADIRTVVQSLTDLPVTVLLSHAHWDHIGGNMLFDEILIHPAEADELPKGHSNEQLGRWFAPEFLTGPLPFGVTTEDIAIPPSHATGFLHDGEMIDLGGRSLDVLHCPGHSPGGVVFLDRANGALFSTDVAYSGFLYAYRGPSLAMYLESLRRLERLALELRVLYPSHNDAVISPEMIAPMAELLQRVADGEAFDFIMEGIDVYGNREMGVLVFPER